MMRAALVVLSFGLISLPSIVHGQVRDTVHLHFTWWGSDVRKVATDDALALYEQKHPGVALQGESQPGDRYEARLQIKLLGDSLPDLFQIDSNWLPDFVGQTNRFVDLSHEKALDLSQFSQTVLDRYCTVGGKLLGIPMGINGYGLMVNKTFLKKFHVPVNTVWTWDKIIEEGRRIHQEDKSAYLLFLDTQGLSLYFFNEYLRSKTGKVWVGDDGTLACSQADFIEAFTVLKRIYDEKAAAPLSDTMPYELKLEQSPAWTGGRVGMTPDWSGTLLKYKASVKPENFAVSRNIQVKDGVDQTTPTKPSMLLAVSAKSPHKEEAIRLANWLVNDPEAARILKAVRSVPGSTVAHQTLMAANLIDKDVAQMVDWSSANPAPFTFLINNAAIIDVVRHISQKVIYGEATPAAAAEELMGRVPSKFQEIKQKS